MEYKKSYKKWSNKGKTLNPESLTVNQGRPEPKRKRGKLAPLMSEDAKATASIHELSYDFGCRITTGLTSFTTMAISTMTNLIH